LTDRQTAKEEPSVHTIPAPVCAPGGHAPVREIDFDVIESKDARCRIVAELETGGCR